MAGLYFEEFSEGQVFEHALSRTVTEMDNVLFTTLTMNPQPLHLDAEFAKTTEFGRPLVNSIFTLGLVIGMTVGDTNLGTTVANLGMSDVRFPKPVFHGDTIRARSTVVSVRKSRSRSDAGIVEFEHVGLNQRGEEVAICRRAALMKTRPACSNQGVIPGRGRAASPEPKNTDLWDFRSLGADRVHGFRVSPCGRSRNDTVKGEGNHALLSICPG